MPKRFMSMIVTVVVVAGVCPAAFADDGDAQCSVKTLRGRYVFSANGFTIDPVSGVARPKAIIEVIDFNGDGTMTVQAGTRSVNGAITRFLPTAFTYTLEDTCTGTITFDGPTFDIFVAPRGNQLWLIQTNSNNVFEGSATRTSHEPADGDRH